MEDHPHALVVHQGPEDMTSQPLVAHTFRKSKGCLD